MDSIQTLGQSLDHWQALYIVAIAVAFASTAAIVTFAFHIQEHRHGLKVSNYIYVIASLLAVISTIVIVNKTKSLDTEKDRQAKATSDAAALQTQQAKTTADTANAGAKVADQKAQEARDKADATEKENLQLRVQLKKESARASTAEEGLAVQQQGMAKQMMAAATLSEAQATVITAKLKPFAGMQICIMNTVDPPTARIVSKLLDAIKRSGVDTCGGSMADFDGRRYGITIFYKNHGRPALLALALHDALKEAGLAAQLDPDGNVPNSVVGPTDLAIAVTVAPY